VGKKRLFVGIFTPLDFEEVRREVEELGVVGKWVERENLHVTLRFIGEVEEEKVPQIARMLKGRLKGAPKVRLSYRGLGTFNRNGLPRVLWVGVEGEGLKEVKRRVDQALMPFGLPPEDEESYRPHITLLRIKKLRRRGKFSGILFRMREFDFGGKESSKVCLIESKLTPEGPVYEVVEEFPLG